MHAAVTSPAAANLACPKPIMGLVAFGIDPTQTVQVKVGQSFLLAMRGGGFSTLAPWAIVGTPPQSIAVFVRDFTIASSAFDNADRKPGDPPLADGPSTQYFYFEAKSVGTMTIVFGRFRLDDAQTPAATKTFMIDVRPSTIVC